MQTIFALVPRLPVPIDDRFAASMAMDAATRVRCG
jgi:hypothetical protein